MPLVWLRWAQFVDLALVFGVPLTAWLLGDRRIGGGWRIALGVAVAGGAGLAVAGFLVTLAAMADSPVGELDRATIVMMASQSALGWSVIARLAALALGLVLLCRGGRPAGMALAGGLAVATLAWGGHAAASQGIDGAVRLAGDIAHLWCGLAWLGALMLFTARLWHVDSHDRLGQARLARGLGAFALIGGVLVGVVVVSGVSNLLFLMPPAQWPGALRTPYGQAMGAKLAMAGLMVLLASGNRFRLVPALEGAGDRPARARAIRALRISISLETMLALGVVACIALAGTLDPAG